MNKLYQIIYADPPWRYDFSKDNSDKIENHYPTMNIEDICSIPVPAGDNCILFMWATAPKLLEAIKVLDAWGFTYKTNAVWDKGWVGMGYWFRGQHEILIIGTKGKVSPPKAELRISSVIKCKKGKHSEKPETVRKYIEKCYPNCSKLEMFARPNTPLFDDSSQWDYWGNELTIVKDAI